MTKRTHPLEQVRLDRDWSFQQLADAIKAVTKHTRNQDCWRRICQLETSTPNDRTQHLIDQFLASVDGTEPTNGTRKRKAA